MTDPTPYRPETPREVSAWYGLPPERREELQRAWRELLPLARATEQRRHNQRNNNQRSTP